MAEVPIAPVEPGARRSTGAVVVRSSLLTMLALAAIGLTRVIHGSLVSHATDNPTYGLVGNLIAVTVIASLLLPAGVSSASSKFIPFHRGAGDLPAARAVHRFLSMLGVAGSVLLGVVAGAGAWAAYGLSAGQAVSVGVLATAFSLYSIDKASLYGFAKVGPYVWLELSCSALAVLATVAVVVTGSTAYLVPLALGYGSFVLGARYLLRADTRGEVGAADSFDRREVLGYVLLASIGTLAGAGFLQGTQLLARAFAQPTEVAYFTAAVTLVTPMYFLPRALAIALFPTMAEAHGAGDADAVRRHADLSTRALFVLLAPLFVAGVFVAREVLILVYPNGYAEGAPVLQLLLTATYLAVTPVAAVNALSSGTARQVRIPVTSAVVGCLVGLLVAALLGGPLGAAGVGLAYLVGTSVTASGPVTAVWRQYGLAWRGPVARSIGVVGGALVGARLLDLVPWSGSAKVVLDFGVALLAAAAAATVLRRDIATVLRAGMRRRSAAQATVRPGDSLT